MAEATGNVLNVPGTSGKPTTTDDEILASYAGLNQKGLTLLKSSAAAFGTPTTPTAATATTGGTIPASTTYYYVYTAVSANGESPATAQVSQATGGGTATNTITVTMTAVSGAQGYRVYRASTTGGPYSFLAATPGGTVTYVDTGAATPNPALNPPSVDGSARTIWATGTVLKLSGTAKKYTAAVAADIGAATTVDVDAVGILRKDVDVSTSDKLGNIVLAGVIKGSKVRYADRYPLSVTELGQLALALGGRYVAYNDTIHF